MNTAVSEGLLDPEQANHLWDFWADKSATTGRQLQSAVAAPEPRQPPRFDGVHAAYYGGALLVIGAMGWFMGTGWESFGGADIFAISCVYAMCFIGAGHHLWHKKSLHVPGGLLITMAVCMTPLATYGLERVVGLWPDMDPGSYRGFHVWIKGGWFYMEVATLIAGIVAIRFYRFPFLIAPLAFTLWYMSMDLAPLIFGANTEWHARNWVSAAVGVVMLIAGFQIDRRTRQDFAFWAYLFGLLAFCGGLTSMNVGGELNKFLYCLVNLGLIVIAIMLKRRVFMVFGVLGVTGYVGHLAWDVFKDSLGFPFVLTLVGLSIIASAVHYHRNRSRFEAKLLSVLPAAIKNRLPNERVHQNR